MSVLTHRKERTWEYPYELDVQWEEASLLPSGLVRTYIVSCPWSCHEHLGELLTELLQWLFEALPKTIWEL